ncbi:cysteine and glycine-rich protein 3 [Ceratobasidium sp. AG-Ba]|nr:cysteine and glycine-rich protein 3 [Ceratobasidium sp. AG-Ba]QRV99436.1 cysteine and glycine-rich protein 3 [Ceratobasidium sp. AG-Ba]QRW13942.1 cysteine and glycine-rich protein 3 [Ceratobasidium sp. AG-Ba]
MNPFGAPSKCPRCEKTVYAAEQIIGPGRQVYHKFCLKCTECNKRLDSYSLVEHKNEPYCKGCHIRSFGTQDLRHQNLTQASPPASPPSQKAPTVSSPASIDSVANGFGAGTLRRVPNPPITPPRTISPVTESREAEPQPHPDSIGSQTEPGPMSATESDCTMDGSIGEVEADPALQPDEEPTAPPPLPARTPSSSAPELPPRITTLKNTRNFEYRPSKPNTPTSRFPAPLSPSAIKRGKTGFAALRAGPPSPTRRAGLGADGIEFGSTPLAPSATGGSTPMRSFPSSPAATYASDGNWRRRVSHPTCFYRCSKAVYHAEQVTGPGGRKYHKLCLKCVQCNTSLDSGKLTEKDGEPMCRNCYSKTHGPQGSGYALIGRAG